MGHIQHLGSKGFKPWVVVPEQHKSPSNRPASRSEQTASEICHHQKPLSQNPPNNGVNHELHEALLQLITELEELLENH